VANENIVGKRGQVSGTVRPGHYGEVMLHAHGGVEAYYAKPYDGQETIPVGSECIVPTTRS